jgi:hypothetical protein
VLEAEARTHAQRLAVAVTVGGAANSMRASAFVDRVDHLEALGARVRARPTAAAKPRVNDVVDRVDDR